MKRSFSRLAVSLVLSLAVMLGMGSSSSLWACACGCGVFDVGSSMFPTRLGGRVSVEYASQQQNRSWHGDSPASADDNEDKKISSDFFTLGLQYMFKSAWGTSLQVPVVTRYVKGMDHHGMGEIESHSQTAVGDLRLRGIYTGLSESMATGLTLGMKLPTGSFHNEHLESDTQIGSGSTDLLVGGFHSGAIAGKDRWKYFSSTELDLPVLHAGGYTPGSEMNAAAGVFYSPELWCGIRISPLLQLKGTHRWSDSGEHAMAEHTGYSRLLLAPGFEIGTEQVRLYADIGFPVYQHTTGHQLVASHLLKVNLGYHF